MEAVRPYCSELDNSSFQGTEDAYKYLCDTHKEGQ